MVDETMPKNNRLRVAIYGRVSSSAQHSTSTQIEVCRRLVKERGWLLHYQLRDDALKGRDPTRPGYQRLLELAKDKRIDVIVVWKLDRLFRSLKEASAAQENLKDAGVCIVSCTEPFDTTSTIGRFIFGFLANVAQFETDLIRERSLLGFERRVNEGKWTGSHPPFGYCVNDDGFLSIQPDEAELIRIMARNYAKEGGDTGLAAWMRDAGYARRGKPWAASNVRQALTQPLLLGQLTQRGTTSSFPDLAILSPRVAARLREARRTLRYGGKQLPIDRRAESLDRVMNAYHEYLQEAEADPGIDSSPSFLWAGI